MSSAKSECLDPNLDVLEVTLRDGSYAVDFQFTAEDTAITVAALESAGIRWIEIGHGLGLNASATGRGDAAASDDDYLDAAARTSKQAHWGMFFIPGIGRLEDIRRAAKYGMHFLRIGTNVTEVDAAESPIKTAKELGMFVSYNAMKSYAVTPPEFAALSAQARKWGADMVCLVDSAGGMFPDDVSAYFKAVQSESDVPMGFHGHDNLALAMANTLCAIECGATLVDTSLQGIGRSAGNTVTEILVPILQRSDKLMHIDAKAVMDLGQTLIDPAFRRRGVDPMTIVSGAARFHSSFTPKVQHFADKYRLDIRDLIVRLCEEDLVDAPDELLESLGQELASRRPPRSVAISLPMARSKKGTIGLAALIAELRSLAVKRCRFSTLNVVVAEHPLSDFRVSANMQQSAVHVIGSVAVSSDDQLKEVLRLADGRVNLVLLDIDSKPHGPSRVAEGARELLTKTALLTYSDSDLWVRAVESQLVRHLDEIVAGAEVVIFGVHAKSLALAKRLLQRGMQTLLVDLNTPDTHWPNTVLITPESKSMGIVNLQHFMKNTRAVVAWTESVRYITEVVDWMPPKALLIDAQIGGLSSGAITKALERGMETLRVNIWPELAGTLLAAHDATRARCEAFGRDVIAAVRVVAGGAIGEQGDVIVDSVREPTRIIGVADGCGGVIFDYSTDIAARVEIVEQEIRQRLLVP